MVLVLHVLIGLYGDNCVPFLKHVTEVAKRVFLFVNL